MEPSVSHSRLSSMADLLGLAVVPTDLSGIRGLTVLREGHGLQRQSC